MTISVKILADSLHPDDQYRDGGQPRLTTFLWTYPRFIHAEVMTHRVFSRNASSSRAIPVLTMIRAIRKDPAMPVHWGSNRPGMQAGEELTGWRLAAARFLWLAGMWIMTTIAWLGAWLGMHKQTINRLIEPWAHITVVVTATEWWNFFYLRVHKDAQPDIRVLAEMTYKLYTEHKPRVLEFGDWHTPFVEVISTEDFFASRCDVLFKVKCSVARCARTSYKNHDKSDPDWRKDFKLHDDLVVATPMHASPAEHQATPMRLNERTDYQGNLRGFHQYRKTLKNENQCLPR